MDTYRNSTIDSSMRQPVRTARAMPAQLGQARRLGNGTASAASGSRARGMSDPGATGDLSDARAAASRSAVSAPVATSAQARGARPCRRSNFMRYAADNRAVRGIYEFTTGRFRPLFIALVVIAIGIGVYFPVRDYYTATRSKTILAEQSKIVKAYKKQLKGDVNTLLSEDGVKDTASKKLNMVMPGEKTINVVGLDDTSSSKKQKKSKKSKKANAPTTATELEEALDKVESDVPWYVHALDVLFNFKGVDGQEVTSTGK